MRWLPSARICAGVRRGSAEEASLAAALPRHDQSTGNGAGSRRGRERCQGGGVAAEELTEEDQAAYRDQGEPFEFGHSLEDQVAGQLRAGMVLVDLYEDSYLPEEDVLSRHIKTFVATRARRIAR